MDVNNEYNYCLIGTQYVLHKGDQPLGAVLDEVSLAIDTHTGSVLKHGGPEMVTRYVQDTRAALRAGNPAWADALVQLTGRLKLEDLNKCLSISGFAGKLWAKAQAGTLAHEPDWCPPSGHA